MKKRFLLILGLIVLMLFSSGCAEKKTSQSHVEEFSGKCSIYVVKDNGFYYPTIVGEIALSFLPSKLVAICADENIELEIKSTNRSNGLFILSFKQVHIFNFLEEKDYVIDMKIYYGGKVLCVCDFAVFSCDDDYFMVYNTDNKNGACMDKEANWTPFA